MGVGIHRAVPNETRPRSRSTIPAWVLALAGIAIVGLAVFAIWRLGQQVAPPPLVRVSIVLPEKSLVRSLAVSPEGDLSRWFWSRTASSRSGSAHWTSW